MSSPDSDESGRPPIVALSSREGFLAMIDFLESFFDRAGPDVGTLMTDLEIQSDGQPMDPAAWTDWLKAIENIRQEGA